MTRLRIALVSLAAAVAMLSLPPPAWAEPTRKALVIGNGTYGTLPPVPGCLQSAHIVAAALRGLGFDVVEREDLSTGGTDAAMTEFARELAGGPALSAVVYACGYVTPFNDRSFLLPVTATVGRPADVLTQGVLVKTLLDVVGRGGVGAALVAIDGVTLAGNPAQPALDELARLPLPPGFALIAARQAPPTDTSTPLAGALATNLRGPQVTVAPLLDKVKQQLAGTPVTLAALRAPAEPIYLAGAPAPPPATPVQAPAAPPPPPSPPVQAPTAPIPAPAVAPAPAPPLVAMPADEAMTDMDRRTVQRALARLGYYPGLIDGIFGPDTRAAIRRYQHELGADMTGRLTAEQASRLVTGR